MKPGARLQSSRGLVENSLMTPQGRGPSGVNQLFPEQTGSSLCCYKQEFFVAPPEDVSWVVQRGRGVMECATQVQGGGVIIVWPGKLVQVRSSARLSLEHVAVASNRCDISHPCIHTTNVLRLRRMGSVGVYGACSCVWTS
jgi:hypothetical protein